MEANPITEDCRVTFEKKHHVCFGVSPFNSYFSDSKIEDLARWGKREFQKMHFFVPDGPSVYTLEALGYDSEKAAWKARRQAQYLINKISKALKNVGFDYAQIEEMILNWEKLSENSIFLKLHGEIKSLFDSDIVFREASLKASSWVLEGKLKPGSIISEEQLKHAVRYLLSEIPLFLDTPRILGLESSAFCYHQCIPFIESLIRGQFACQKNPGQGFIIVRPLGHTYRATEISLTKYH